MVGGCVPTARREDPILSGMLRARGGLSYDDDQFFNYFNYLLNNADPQVQADGQF